MRYLPLAAGLAVALAVGLAPHAVYSAECPDPRGPVREHMTAWSEEITDRAGGRLLDLDVEFEDVERLPAEGCRYAVTFTVRAVADAGQRTPFRVRQQRIWRVAYTLGGRWISLGPAHILSNATNIEQLRAEDS